MRILLLNVFKGETFELENCEKWKRPDVEVDFEMAQDYPLEHVYFQYYQSRASDEVAKRVKAAEDRGYDAAVICCMADPGLWEARQIVDIPVVGIFEASALLAYMTAHKYSIVTITKDLIPVMDALATKYGVRDKLASIRHIDVPAWELYPDRSELSTIVERTIAAAEQCVEADAAEAIVMGGSLSGAMFTKADPQDELLRELPIIDPVLAGFKAAEMMADMRASGLQTTSRVGLWKRPPAEDLEQVMSYQARWPR